MKWWGSIYHAYTSYEWFFLVSIKKHDQQSKDGAVVKKVSKARVKKTKEQKKIIRLNDSSIDVLLRKLLVALKG